MFSDSEESEKESVGWGDELDVEDGLADGQNGLAGGEDGLVDGVSGSDGLVDGAVGVDGASGGSDDFNNFGAEGNILAPKKKMIDEQIGRVKTLLEEVKGENSNDPVARAAEDFMKGLPYFFPIDRWDRDTVPNSSGEFQYLGDTYKLKKKLKGSSARQIYRKWINDNPEDPWTILAIIETMKQGYNLEHTGKRIVLEQAFD